MRRRYANYWYGIVLKMLKSYPAIKSENTIQTSIFVNAIERALDDTEALQDGDLRIKAIELIYFEDAVNIDGAACRLNCSRRTVQRWMSSFVRLVGKYAGYQ